MQLGSEFRFWVTLQDRGTNPLWDGSPVYIYCNDETFTMDSVHGMRSRLMPGTPNFVDNNVGEEWNKLKVNNSWVGVVNPKAFINAGWVTDLGSYTDGGSPILTPYKLMVMAASGRTFYLNDERIIKQISIESGGQFYPEFGAPVVIDDFNIKVDMKSTNRVNMNINFREDKDI